jgi:hypothetical protein
MLHSLLSQAFDERRPTEVGHIAHPFLREKSCVAEIFCTREQIDERIYVKHLTHGVTLTPV